MKIGFMTHKHQYNTWQQMKTQGHICREPTGMNIYLSIYIICKEILRGEPGTSHVSCCRTIKSTTDSHSQTYTPIQAHRGSGFHFNMVAKQGQKSKGYINCKSRLNQTSIVLVFRTIPRFISSCHPFPPSCSQTPP